MGYRKGKWASCLEEPTPCIPKGSLLECGKWGQTMPRINISHNKTITDNRLRLSEQLTIA